MKRSVRYLSLLIMLCYFLAQHSLVLAQMMGKLTGHEVSSHWHQSHYDVVMSHGTASHHVAEVATCQLDCSDHHHVDLKPTEPSTASSDLKAKFILIILALLPVFLMWLLPLLLRQLPPFIIFYHRNCLPLLIRSTVLRH